MDAQDDGATQKAMREDQRSATHRSAGWLEGAPVGYPSLCNPSGSLGCPQPPAYFDVERRSC
jgi:hypothetical protein